MLHTPSADIFYSRYQLSADWGGVMKNVRWRNSELYGENKSCDYKEISSPTREPTKTLGQNPQDSSSATGQNIYTTQGKHKKALLFSHPVS